MTHPGPTAAPSLAVIVHPTRDSSAEVAQVVTWAAGHGVAVLCPRDAPAPPGATPVDDDVLARCLGAVAIGGDGTILGALRRFADRPVPVLGVNRGTVGFLAELQPDELADALVRLTAGDVEVDSRPCLEMTGALGRHVAFNDVVLVRLPGRGFGTVRLDVQGRLFGAYRSDALVVSTPMGSTAYSYAAHGPLVSPTADVVTVTPVAPAAGPDRTLVLGPQDVIGLGVEASAKAVEVDGVLVGELGPGDRVVVRLVPDAGRLVRLDRVRQGYRSIVRLGLQDLPLPADELRRLLAPAGDPDDDRADDPADDVTATGRP